MADGSKAKGGAKKAPGRSAAKPSPQPRRSSKPASSGRKGRAPSATDQPPAARLTTSDRLELVADLGPPIWSIADADEARRADSEWLSRVGAMGADLLEDSWDLLRQPSQFEWLLLSFTYGRAALPRSLPLRGWDVPGVAVPTLNGVTLVPKTVLDVTVSEGGFIWEPAGGVDFTMDSDGRISLPRSAMLHLGPGRRRSILAAVDNRRDVTALHLVSPVSMDSLVPSLAEW